MQFLPLKGVSIAKKIAKLALLGAILHWNFTRYGELVGPPAAEVRVAAFSLNDRVDLAHGVFFGSAGLEYAVKGTKDKLGLPVLFYRRKQTQVSVLNSRESWTSEDARQLNSTTNSIIKLLIPEEETPRKRSVFLATGEDEQAAIIQGIAANRDLSEKIDFVDCPDCARTADLTIVPICKNDEPCFGDIRYVENNDVELQDPTADKLRYLSRQFEVGLPCYGDPLIMYSIAPPAQLQDAASQLAIRLSASRPSIVDLQKKKIFRRDLPRNPNHTSFLLYSEAWFHADRCATNRRYFVGEAMRENFFSLVVPTRTGTQTGLGSVCVVSGSQQNLADHAKIVSACIRKWLDPRVELVMKKPEVPSARLTLFGDELPWHGLEKYNRP